MTSDSASSIRLVLSDMDGTILSSERVLSPKTQMAVRHLRDVGIPVALVSARPPQGMMPYIHQLELQGPCAAFNGGLIFDADGTIKHNIVFPSSVAQALLSCLTAHDGDVWFQNKDRWSVRDATRPFVTNESRIIGVHPYEVEDLATEVSEVNRIIAIGDNVEEAARLEQELGEKFAGQASVLRSTPTKINITPAQATKGQAVHKLASFYSVLAEQVACLGDAQNDLPMLSEAGMSIAMGQAPETVKEKASYITGSNAEDGWADAVERFIMPRVVHN
ncbi:MULTISPECIES: Cof-type HAD-IIB family hydrolase [unclassified Saccharibacter]|uniref:Cof-type HAD-IIB family hydrolase n=1 Tax=unclassified Saccharibacter TaxID=2648722 RepID=UPI0013221194|nr:MULTISPECIES: Cof-type HAD-IIB family hydrolase [unclassified Saccharibacter]MXV35191.1 Cof-type HAD-IIB family hydrolase [Saccharibacter sp. EH611]MXV57262.1 Cof-type HAD-IIB family hydrolase [Saccharibacter sp. EH70]MXV64877.1 Cof-type HAD-IIB family hydrolase [Saccharibacter sp. EH60]